MCCGSEFSIKDGERHLILTTSKVNFYMSEVKELERERKKWKKLW